MLMMKRGSVLLPLLLCGLMYGCASTANPPAPAAAGQMSQAQMEALGADAEAAIARADYANAAVLYERLLQSYPNSAAAWFRLGTVHLRLNQQRVAQYDFERALQADPNLSKAQANLALTHLKQFRVAASVAIASDQVSEDNRATLRALMRDVDHALYPPATLSPTVNK